MASAVTPSTATPATPSPEVGTSKTRRGIDIPLGAPDTVIATFAASAARAPRQPRTRAKDNKVSSRVIHRVGITISVNNDSRYVKTAGSPPAGAMAGRRWLRGLMVGRNTDVRVIGGDMSDATERAPSLVADRYRLDERIGSGPMGEVWRGYDTRADWVVAVKVLGAKAAGPATREVLKQHAQAVAKVIHPNVAMVLDVGDEDGAPFLVMEFLTGLSLGEELAARGPLPIVEVCDLIGQAAAGLDAAHRAGVVHGQIDPHSFRRAGSGVLKAVGFGMDGKEPPVRDPRYVAPERVAGRAAQAPGDLYALGTVCYELLCGRPPSTAHGPGSGGPAQPGVADTPGGAGGGTGAPDEAGTPGGGGPGGPGAAGTAPARGGEPAPPSAHRPEVPVELDRLVLAMLAEDPAKRPAGGESIRRALAAIARPRANPAAPPMTGAPGGGPEAGPGATEVYQFAVPRAGDTAIYQAGDLEPAPAAANRKLFVQLGAAVGIIAVVVVAMVVWASGPGQRTGAVPTPSSEPSTVIETPFDPPSGTPTPGVVTTLDTEPTS
ncbi:serine/threonine protein kinase, partial [Nonomuraea sp. KC401]